MASRFDVGFIVNVFLKKLSLISNVADGWIDRSAKV